MITPGGANQQNPKYKNLYRINDPISSTKICKVKKKTRAWTYRLKRDLRDISNNCNIWVLFRSQFRQMS